MKTVLPHPLIIAAASTIGLRHGGLPAIESDPRPGHQPVHLRTRPGLLRAVLAGWQDVPAGGGREDEVATTPYHT
jgi:hypothetical protein